MISHFLGRRPLQVLIITTVCFLAYSNTLNCPFTFDDASLEQYKFFNIDKNHFLAGLVDFSKTQRSLTVATFIINYKLHGFKPFGYHVVNLFIQILNALLLYWFVLLTLNCTKLRHSFNERTASLAAFFTASLFAVHPLGVMSVTFTIQRFTSLAAMFYLLTIVLYAKYRILSTEGCGSSVLSKHHVLKRIVYYTLSLVAALISTRTKEIVVTLPVVLLLYDYMFYQDTLKKILIRCLPFFIIIPIIFSSSFSAGLFNTVGVLNALRVSIYKSASEKSGTTANTHKDRAITLRQNQEALESIKEGPAELMKVRTWKEHALTQLRVTCSYLRMLVLPYKLAPIYFYPASRSFGDPSALASLAFLGLIVFVSVFLFIRYRSNDKHIVLIIVPFGMFWFFFNILPQSVVRAADNWVIFDYRTYLPSTGFLFVLVTMIFYFTGQRHRKIATALLIFTLITFAALTYKRNSYWKTEEMLWQENIRNYPLNPIPHINLANTYLSMEQYEKAMKEFRKALEMDPWRVEVYNNTGTIYIRLKDNEKAEEEFRKALRIRPDFPEAHHNLGNLYLEQGLDDKAMLEYSLEASFDLRPADAFMGMGGIYLKKGKISEALQCYKKAIAIRSDFPEAHFYAGVAYDRLGNVAEALREFQIAAKLRPGYSSAYMNIGNVFLRQGLLGDALRQFQKVLHYDSTNAAAHASIANVYADAGQLDGAINEYKTAIALKPDVAEFHNNLGTVYQVKGLIDLAEYEYKTALTIDPNYINAKDNLRLLTEKSQK
ncbi:MAG: tetratricopeptide repeat protein [Nitrospirae bacterium YQR-1]